MSKENRNGNVNSNTNAQQPQQPQQPTLHADVVSKAQESHDRRKVGMLIALDDKEYQDILVKTGIQGVHNKHKVELATMEVSILHGLKREAMKADVLQKSPDLVSKIKAARELLAPDKPEVIAETAVAETKDSK